MSGLILHHYPTSPYGEMVRIALGFKGLAWESCEQSVILPRPELMALTGGYRRIPVLQIGADIYCDSQAILRAIEAVAPTPSCGSGGLGWMARSFAERAWFGVTVGVIFGARGPSVPEAFIKDREQLSGRPFDIPAMSAAAPMLRGQWRRRLRFWRRSSRTASRSSPARPRASPTSRPISMSGSCATVCPRRSHR